MSSTHGHTIPISIGRELASAPGAVPAAPEQRLAALLASLTEAILTIDDLGAIESVNPAAERLFDYPATELVGRSFDALLGGAHREELRAVTRAFMSGQRSEALGLSREVVGRRRDGSTFPLELTLTEMRTTAGPLLVALARDVSERKRTEDQLRQLAAHDRLTGFLNRAGFEGAVSGHIDYAARYGGAGSLLLVDLDNFKYVNDTLSHAAGDELIQGVAELLRSRLRKTDVIGRLGGDEFGVLLHEADAGRAAVVAEELRELIADHPFVLNRQPVRTTVSIGVASLHGEQLTAAELLGRADAAVYGAKDQGRNRVVEFSTEGQAELAAHRAMAERIRRATEQGLFVLVCQPILELASDEVSQYELLLRMRGPEGELIPPGAFLSTAERFGLIQGIDRWVAQQAVRLIAGHRKAGRDLTLEVNLSALSMNDPELATMVERELKATGVDPSRLVFEVTETAAIADFEPARAFAETLTRIGCRFALDDFGAGFASFYYLKHLPISYLKIDGEFVRNLARTEIDQVLVKALVQVSRGLGIKTIAEFVGDQETLEMLRDLGVDYAQGYHVGRPHPVADLRPDSALAPV